MLRHLRSFTSLVCLSALATICRAEQIRVYHVAMDGRDANDGSLTRPWRTLGWAVAHIPPGKGSRLQIAAGRYVLTRTLDIPPGVSLEGAGSKQTILAGASTREQGGGERRLLRLTSKDHQGLCTTGDQTLQGFTLEGGGSQKAPATKWEGVEVAGRSGVSIHNLVFSNLAGVGLELRGLPDPYQIEPQSRNLFSGCATGIEVYGCAFTHCLCTSGCLRLNTLDGAAIHDNVILGERGIVTAGKGIFRRCRIDHNTILSSEMEEGRADALGITLRRVYEDCEVDHNRLDCGILLEGERGTGTCSVHAHDNRIVYVTAPKERPGFEILCSDAEIDHNYVEAAAVGIEAPGGSISHLQIHHNVFYDMRGPVSCGLLLREPVQASDWTICNNVFHGAGRSRGGVIGIMVQCKGGGSLNRFVVENNLFLNTAFDRQEQAIQVYGGVATGSLSADYNRFFQVEPYPGKNNTTGDPGLLFSGARPLPYYCPTGPESPVVDAGTPVDYPFRGAAPTIGAYEFYQSYLPPEVIGARLAP